MTPCGETKVIVTVIAVAVCWALNRLMNYGEELARIRSPRPQADETEDEHER
jgi:hypothetical protein